MIILIILSILFFASTVYFAYRAFILAGLIADSEDYYKSVAETNQYMYRRIEDSYNEMKRIDRLGAFEKDDESGTTFELLTEVIENLKGEFNAEEEEEKQ